MDILNLIHPVQGHECLSACIGNILNVKYQKIAANEIIIGGDGFFITYDKYRKVIGSPMYEANYNFMDKYEVKYRHKKFESTEEAVSFLEEALSKEVLLILKVDAKQLVYSRVFGQATDSPHFINVLRKRQEQYDICDGYVPTRDATVFEGTMEKSQVINAWKDMKFEYLVLETLPEKNEKEMIEEIEKSLFESIRKYCQGGMDNNIYYGKDAIYEMFLEGQKHLERSRAYEVNYQLRIYGFLDTKEMVCSMLQKRERYQKEAQEYAQIIQEWDRLCMVYLKAVISKNKEQYERFLQKIRTCIEAEDRVLIKIIS